MNGYRKRIEVLRRASPTRRGSLSILAAIAVVATLYFAKPFLIPFALAILLSFLLAPLVTRLQRWGVHNGLAVLLSTIVGFTLIGGLLAVVGYQFVDLVEQVPSYEKNLRGKIRELRNPWGSSFRKTSQTVDDLAAELRKSAQGRAASTSVAKVQLVPNAPDAMELARQMLGPIVKPLSTTLVIVVFVIFMLLERVSLRDRLIALIGPGDVFMTTQALDEAANRVTRYLLMQSIINTAQGIAVAIGLHFIGIPNVMLWGALSMALRFLPYIGPWIAAAVPIALSIALFDDWMHPLLTFALYASLELIVANFLEPWAYGSRTGISPLALLVAAAFWTWLWGIPGLLLAVPITVCLFVAGKYVPQLRVFTVLLGDEPALEHYERLYQRLLLHESQYVEHLLEGTIAETSLVSTIDRVIVPMLELARSDVARGALDTDAHQLLIAELRSVLEHAVEHVQSSSESQPMTVENTASVSQVFCVAASDETDEFVAWLLVRLLTAAGLEATVVQRQALMDAQCPDPCVICISALPPDAFMQAQRLCRSLRQRFPEAIICVGLWHAEKAMQRKLRGLRASGAQRTATTLAAAVAMLARAVRNPVKGAGSPNRPVTESRLPARSA